MVIAHCNSPIGIIRIEKTDAKISAIIFLEEGTELIQSGTELLKTVIQQIDEYFAGKRSMFDFPFHQPGTTFQQQVWQELGKQNYFLS